MPKVSICIPAYNKPESLRRALASIESQKYPDFEVIITDDTPNDSVGIIAREFDKKFELYYFRNEVRRGSPENFNEAIRHSHGEYIKMLCDDDWFFDENSLRSFVSAFDENPNASLAFCLSRNIDAITKKEIIRPVSQRFLYNIKHNFRTVFPRNFIGSPSAVIFRKKEGRYFDAHLKWVVDIVFYANILKEEKEFVFIDMPLVNITTGDAGQVTSLVKDDKKLELFEWFYAYRQIYSKLTWRPEVLYLFYYLMKKYRVKSVLEIPDFSLLPTGVQRMVSLSIHIPDIFNIALSYE